MSDQFVPISGLLRTWTRYYMTGQRIGVPVTTRIVRYNKHLSQMSPSVLYPRDYLLPLAIPGRQLASVDIKIVSKRYRYCSISGQLFTAR